MPSKGVSFRVVSGASVTPGVVSLLAYSACLYSRRARTYNTGRCARRSAMFIAPKSHCSRWVSTRMRKRARVAWRISCRKLCAGQSANSRFGGCTEDGKDAKRESLAIGARTWPSSREEKIRLDIAAILYDWIMFGGVL